MEGELKMNKSIISRGLNPYDKKRLEAMMERLDETETIAGMAYVTSEYLAALQELDEMEV